MTRYQVLGAVTVFVLAAAAVVVFLLPDWLWHPIGYCVGTPVQIRDCKGYNVWSGIISDMGEVTLVGGMLTLVGGFWHSHNCHQYGCPWLVFHPHPDHGHPVCRKHYQQHPDGNIPGKEK